MREASQGHVVLLLKPLCTLRATCHTKGCILYWLRKFVQLGIGEVTKSLVRDLWLGH